MLCSDSHVRVVRAWESRVSSGLKHGLAGGGVGSRGESVLGYLRVHKVHSRNVNLKVC